MMSSTSRIISGSYAGLTRNFFSVLINIIALPIYLSYWSVDLYATWILLLAIIVLIKIPIFSYQQYLENEFLKLGKNKKDEISEILYSSTLIIFILSIVVLAITIVAIESSDILYFFKIKESFIDSVKTGIIILFTAEIVGFLQSLFLRALYPFGYYPKVSWVGLIHAVLVPLSQIIPVILGFKLIGVCIATFLVLQIYWIVCFFIFFKIYKKEKILFKKFEFKKNLNHLKKSTFLLFSNSFHFIREEGVRLILAPVVGTIEMVAFAIMRAGSNFIQRFLSAGTGSILVEFIGYINANEKEKFSSIITIMYFVLCFVIMPFALIVQFVAPFIFKIWTKNLIIFDPIVFATLTSMLLITITYKPAQMIISGKNIYKSDFLITLITGLIYIFSLFYLVPKLGIRGAGYSLFFGQIAYLIIAFYIASKWLNNNFISFPKKIFILTISNLFLTILFIFAIIHFNERGFFLFLIYIFIQTILIIIFWLNSSNFTKNKLKNFHKIIFNFNLGIR